MHLGYPITGRAALPFATDSKEVDEMAKGMLRMMGKDEDLLSLLFGLFGLNGEFNLIHANKCLETFTNRPKYAFGVFVLALDHECEEIRLNAIRILAQNRDDRATGILYNIFEISEDDSEGETRCNSEAMRLEAALALAQIGSERSLGLLLSSLESKVSFTRLTATRALEEVGMKICPFLIQTLEERNGRTASQVALMLSNITGQDFGTDVDQWTEWHGRQEQKIAV